ncbi:galectin-9 [Caerostris extrusa]|uniref:Galectin n=1 Tax=Caerostris extrusa TaxID=172846 RepID=A0AAV4STP5_CAEEX|nr:galectin-9 [Caerostris extrusa]
MRLVLIADSSLNRHCSVNKTKTVLNKDNFFCLEFFTLQVFPYRGSVPGGVYEGKLIEIRGTVPYGAQRFEINLMTGYDPSSDRALHLSVRFDGRIVVRNSMERGAWGIEERQGIFPFSSGRDFTIMILAEISGYRIAVNSQHCWEYNHRISMSRVSSIYIDGTIQIERIEFIDKTNPYLYTGYYPTCPVAYPASYITPAYITSPYLKQNSLNIKAILFKKYNLTYHSNVFAMGICPIPAIPSNPGIYPVPSFPGNPSVCPNPSIPSFPGPGVCPIPSIPSFPNNPGTRPNPSIPSYPSNPGGFNPGTCVVPPPEQFQPYQPSGRSSLAPVYNPSIPYAYPVYGGLKPGMMVYISGRPSASAHRFTINFQNGTAPYPPPDISFHFDVRFFSRSIIRNSRVNNTWDREETLISHFPFQQAVNFDLIIRIENDRYMVALNGQHFVEFKHRMKPLDRFDTLYIENDIVVSSIRFS